MDLKPEAISDVVHPTALFAPPDHDRHDDVQRETSELGDTARSHCNAEAQQPDWDWSQLNPKNRVDSLDIPTPGQSDHVWQIHGSAGLGTQYYAVPAFMQKRPPMRVDVFIPSLSLIPRHIREVLDLNIAFHTKDGPRVRGLGISRHIVRKLWKWTKSLPDPYKWYTSLPFGSRIVFENLSLHLDDIRINIGQTTYLEVQLRTPADLKTFWRGKGVELPQEIDLRELHTHEQLHDSVALVSLGKEVYVLKALTSYPKFMYHELKNLLLIPPHPNIISRPVHIVTKPTNWGPRKIIGFTVEYHQGGTLRDVVPRMQLNGTLSDEIKIKWSLQILSALVHVRQTTGIFYPDLRLDNIVLGDDGQAIMIDFEQRGVWCEFASPEVNYIEYIRILAMDDDLPEDVRAPYAAVLARLFPDYQKTQDYHTYREHDPGYNISWLCLSPAEQEAAEVYMVGRVIWCIWEGVSAPQRAAVWQSYPLESDLEFPAYRRAPPAVRAVVDACTRGRRPLLASLVVRDRGRLELAAGPRGEAGPGAEGVRRVARAWWEREVGEAMRFVEMREAARERGDWDGNYFKRPGMAEVLRELEAIRDGFS